MSLKIAIIDYDAGNLRNVQKAFEHLGQEPSISNKIELLEEADALILPGVGSFNDGMNALARLSLETTIRKEVLDKKKPILGICLGMHLMAIEGIEGGVCSGLGLLPMKISALPSHQDGIRLPHMGWDNVAYSKQSILFAGLPPSPDFYFVHSYHALCEDNSIIAATCEYGTTFAAAVEKDNIFAVQFHPEKSQRYGLDLLSNFIGYCKKHSGQNEKGRETTNLV